MNIVFNILLVLHLLGWAIVLGGAVTNLRTPRIAAGVLHGALTALVTGIAMFLLLAPGSVGHEEPSIAKFGVKLLVTVVVTGLVIVGNNRPERVTRGLLGVIAGLVVLNVGIAVLWP